MKIESLKPNMRVWDVGRRRMGNTTLSTVCVWPVDVKLVDLEGHKVTASWNGNSYRTFSEHEASRWRLSEPVTVAAGMMGRRRLATRAELKAMKHSSAPAELG